MILGAYYCASILFLGSGTGELHNDGGNKAIVGKGNSTVRRGVIGNKLIDTTIAVVRIEGMTDKRRFRGRAGCRTETWAISVLKIATESRREATVEKKVLLGRINAIKASTGAEIATMLVTVDEGINKVFGIRVVGAVQERSTQAKVIEPFVMEVEKILLCSLMGQFQGKEDRLRDKIRVGIRDKRMKGMETVGSGLRTLRKIGLCRKGTWFLKYMK